MRVRGEFPAPRDSDSVALRTGRKVTWTKIQADKDGWITADVLGGGYAFATIDNDGPERVMILDAAGHTTVFVNGEPRVGDPYEYGYVRLPILLKHGRNEFLFACGRGRFRAKLVDPPAPFFFDPLDVTTPDFVRGQPERQPYGVVYVNATTEPVGSGSWWSAAESRSYYFPPLSIRKVALEFAYDGKNDDPQVQHAASRANYTAKSWLHFRVREPGQTRKITFISDIDGSAQYYALNPAATTAANPALVLSLHGAAVEATSQADAYAPKSWADIVCPTNRRPYGFDWEDWGRLDALEVLEHAIAMLDPDASSIYLTGHSMGGHGAWQLGALFPDRFAAIGPSAGWISFSTYAGGTSRPTTQAASPIAELMRRANGASDTAAFIHNYAAEGVYILHGADDDNVPVEQARQMQKLLAPFHHDVTYHEEPHAGHWWDKSDKPGADCVDWPAMWEFFLRHRLPEMRAVREVNFTTPNPGVSARCHWLTIEAQLHAMIPSAAHIRVEPEHARFVGTTQNVARLSLDLLPIAPIHRDELTLELDGQAIKVKPSSTATRVCLQRAEQGWKSIPEPSKLLKGPGRAGPFKDAFRNRMIFVYGTHGTAEENAWALAKARFDAETFWYRGNGSVPVIPDTMFDPADNPDRNVILYGHADMNSRWPLLLGDSPVHVRRGGVTIGLRDIRGADLACLFVRPRPGSDRACVGAIAGTGMNGMRVTERLPIFVSGVGFPDCTIIGADAFQKGLAGLRAAGFFGNDWSIERGEFVFSDDGKHDDLTTQRPAPPATQP
jgi:poly(3-hydroxybutyrate) depolymerase